MKKITFNLSFEKKGGLEVWEKQKEQKSGKVNGISEFLYKIQDEIKTKLDAADG